MVISTDTLWTARQTTLVSSSSICKYVFNNVSYTYVQQPTYNRHVKLLFVDQYHPSYRYVTDAVCCLCSFKDIFLALCHTLLDIKSAILLVNGHWCGISKSAGLSMRVMHYRINIHLMLSKFNKTSYTTTERNSLG